MITTLSGELGIDRARVFMAGWDDGAIRANALACRLGPSVLRGVGIEAGTLYPSQDSPDFSIDETTGAASCPLPPALSSVGHRRPDSLRLSIDVGRDTKNTYAATQACSDSSVPWPPAAPCVSYSGCMKSVVWCEIPGLNHELWPDAGRVMWSFFSGL